jgi:hypothetical protein
VSFAGLTHLAPAFDTRRVVRRAGLLEVAVTADRDPPERPKPADLESLKQELLSLVRGLAADVEAGRIVEEWEITELGKEIERQSYSPSNDE